MDRIEYQSSDTEGVRLLLGNPRRAIIKLSLPMIVAMSIQTIYNFVDAVWVSGLGADALAAVGFFFPFMFMLMALATGLGVGGGSAVARRIGAQDRAGADQVADHTVVLMFFIVLVVTIPFLIFIDQIFLAMGAGEITAAAVPYARILLAGSLIIFFANVGNALLRGEGDAQRSMYAMMAGAILNIVLDPIFIYTLKLGVAGAAWATLISIGLSSSIIFYWIFIKRDTYVTIRLKEFRFNKKIVFDILRVGLPVSIQQLAMSLSVLILNLIVVRAGGSDGVAIFTTGWRVATFASLPLIGMATAVTSVAGAAYGGRDYPRLDIAYMYALKIGIAIEFGVSFLTFILAPQITKLFTYSPDAARLAQALMGFLRTMCLYYPTASLGILSSGLFQGTGKGIFSLIVTIFRTIVLAVPLAYLFALGLDFGLPGVWWGIVSGNIMGGIVAFIWARIYIRNLKG